ncbi:MAG TPA: hypothetical protein PK733_09920 [Clostridiales bacterium]|nr:hypothetical protein [Clostridiales bacterium]
MGAMKNEGKQSKAVNNVFGMTGFINGAVPFGYKVNKNKELGR